MKRTVLYETHVQMGARMVPFAGYEMPVQYDSPKAEHRAVREAVGLFDIDHMGQVVVSGFDALPFLQYIATNDISTVGVDESQYAIMCYADGGTVDDIFVYRRPSDYFVVINASNRSKDLTWMQTHAAAFADVTVADVSDKTCMLAVQGPQAQATLQHLSETDLNTIPFHGSTVTAINGVPTFISATGYTGEYGYELYFPAEHAVDMWHAILEAGETYGIKPCGLAARDSLRFEACLALYGHELTADISPLEAGLGFFVKFDKGAFLGRDALLKQKLEKPERRLACLEMVDKGVPREGYPVETDGDRIGFITTGMYAPTADIYAAMALIARDAYELDREVDVMIRGTPKKARIVRRPFYTPAYRR